MPAPPLHLHSWGPPLSVCAHFCLLLSLRSLARPAWQVLPDACSLTCRGHYPRRPTSASCARPCHRFLATPLAHRRWLSLGRLPCSYVCLWLRWRWPCFPRRYVRVAPRIGSGYLLDHSSAGAYERPARHLRSRYPRRSDRPERESEPLLRRRCSLRLDHHWEWLTRCRRSER